MRVYAWLFLAAVLPASAAAQNLPPVAQIRVDLAEPLVGETITFSAAASFDPDDGPSPLSFAWDFDDGETGSSEAPTHGFAAARAHRVRVTVSDGEASSEAGVTVYVLAEPAPPARSSAALVVGDGLVFVVDPVTGSVHALERDTLELAWTTTLPSPRTLAMSPDGAEIWVACRDGSLRTLRAANGVPGREVSVGAPLDAVVVSPDGARVLLTSEVSGSVFLGESSLESFRPIAVGGGPRAAVIDGTSETAFVASFLTRAPTTEGTLVEIDLASGSTLDHELALDPSPDTASSGGGVPNLLGALAIDPSGSTLWIGGLKSNTGRGARLDGRDLTPENRVRGLLAPLLLDGRVDRVDGRIDTNDAGQVSAIAFSARGRFAFVAQPGIGAISVYDLAAAALFEGREPGATVPFAARIEVGDTPDSLVVDGERLWIRLREAREIVALDITDPARPEVSSRVVLGVDPRPAPVALGALMFHASRAPMFSRGGYISCAGCHPGGAADGRTWDFTQAGEGLRNTIDLRGRAGLGHGPLHWSANFDEVQDFENDIVNGFGGEGLAGDGLGPHPPLGAIPNAGRSIELDGLAAYVSSLDRAPDSPFRAADGLTPAAERGRAIFFDGEVGCADCHAPPTFTDSSLGAGLLHDVGTLRESSGGRLGEALEGLDTPTLLGVWASAPYLHDGRALDLRAVLTEENDADRHGRTSHLSTREIDDLVAYLRQIDHREAERPSGGGCEITSAPREPAFGLWLGLIFTLRRARPRTASYRRGRAAR